MNRTPTILALATLAALGLAARPAAAQTTYFPNSAFITYAITGNVDVGEDSSGGFIDPGTGQPYGPFVAIFNGGSVSNVLSVSANSTVFIYDGGTVGSVGAYQDGIVDVAGGTVTAGVDCVGSSTANVSGGSIRGDLGAQNTSALNVSGGSLGSLSAIQKATVTITGGTFGLPGLEDFTDETSAPFTFMGMGLSALDSGPVLVNGFKTGEDYTLTGILQDGSSVTGDVLYLNSGTPMFILDNVSSAPEPSPFAALAIGALGLSALALKARKRSARSEA